MKLQANILLRVLTPLILLAGSVLLFHACHDRKTTPSKSSVPATHRSQDELKALGIEGDTPADTVATLVGQMKLWRKELETVKASNTALLQENQRLREREQNTDSRINEAINRQQTSASQQQNELLSSLQTQIQQLKGNRTTDDSLAGLGIEEPEAASGDWTLSCVRGSLTSITFIFRDGTVRTLPAEGDKTGNGAEGHIGWLSDPHGLPCIPGERKSNAAEYIGSKFLLAGSSAAAQALANNQTTSTVEDGSITAALMGDSGQYVLGQPLGGGLKESADWFKQRYGQMFDAIYVPPGQAVAIHITRQLAIDYEPDGRRVNYRTTGDRTGDLD
ncbi:TIGR03752 family integrating conjugative element protein [Salmonella enterica]|nr:TIGR03752 family integrating conjugative element protein [Salmonella enterica]